MGRATLQGIPVSPGIAIGKMRIFKDSYLYEKRAIDKTEIESESAALQMASQKVCADLETTMRNIPFNLAEYKEIIAAQKELASDPKILQTALERVREKSICAAWALAETIEELCSLFQGLEDPYLCERAQDIKTIGQALGNALLGTENICGNLSNGVVAARELSPADVMELGDSQAILSVEGGVTSHTAILARGLNIPALVGVVDLFRIARQGETVIVDGLAGKVILDPDEKEIQLYTEKKNNFSVYERRAQHTAHLQAVTKDGKTISVFANLENQDELKNLSSCGAEGIGLYRTEFSYLGDNLPDEETLVDEYSHALSCAYPNKVVFRTLDAGADKILPVQMALHEPNPALGLRGIRFCLRRKDIFRTQLRAILRASRHGKAAIMLPMISTIEEVRATKRLLAELSEELNGENLHHAANLPLGVMIETPASVFISDILADNCDFISIGTNDLLHYLMAIDRNNRHVAYLHRPLHPAFLRSLKTIVTNGHKKGVKISVCGELAADPLGIPILLGLGVDILSAAPKYIPGVKQAIRSLSYEQCARLVEKAFVEQNMSAMLKNLNTLFDDCEYRKLLPNHSIFSSICI